MEVFCLESTRIGDVPHRSGRTVPLDVGRFAHTQGADMPWPGNGCLVEYVRLCAVQADSRSRNHVHSHVLHRRIYVYSDCAPYRLVRSEIYVHNPQTNTGMIGQGIQYSRYKSV